MSNDANNEQTENREDDRVNDCYELLWDEIALLKPDVDAIDRMEKADQMAEILINSIDFEKPQASIKKNVGAKKQTFATLGQVKSVFALDN